MSWAQRRRTLALSIIAAVFLAGAALVLIASLYQAPSCTDGVQNQGEAGVDCGGPCPYLCATQVKAPTPQFVRALSNTGNRTDVIAYVDNPNPAAEVQNAPYTIELAGPDGSSLVTHSGTVDLPPHSTVPIFVPDFYHGPQRVYNGFLSFDTGSMHWYFGTTTPLMLPVSNIQVSGSSTPRITATLGNPTASPLYDTRAIITVFDASGNAIAASQTIVARIPAEGTAPIVFTWNLPFTATPAKEEVWATLPLTGPQ